MYFIYVDVPLRYCIYFGFTVNHIVPANDQIRFPTAQITEFLLEKTRNVLYRVHIRADG